MADFPRALPLTRQGRRFRIRRSITKWVERYILPSLFQRSVRHIAGPHTVSYGESELLAFCVVRNGAQHVHAFLEHHFRLGVRHIALLDNDSTDDTIRLARAYDNVTILHTDSPYSWYENVMKRYLARRFCRNRWALCVDIDEHFDYPFSGTLPLSSLLTYLNQHNYSAVVAQMLDMFADTTLSGQLEVSPGNDLSAAYPYYDISNIRKFDYLWGTPSNPDVQRYHGGIRDSLFGTNNGLTKAALFFVHKDIDLFVHWHHMNNVRVADFTCLLRHYPFVSSFQEKVKQAVNTGNYGHHTIQYENYAQGLRQQPDTPLKRETARKLTAPEDLLQPGFLVASPAFLQWVTQHGARQSFNGNSNQ